MQRHVIIAAGVFRRGKVIRGILALPDRLRHAVRRPG